MDCCLYFFQVQGNNARTLEKEISFALKRYAQFRRYMYMVVTTIARDFIHNKVLAKAQFELFLSIYNTCRGRE